MRKQAGKRERNGREEGFIEVYIEIEYNRYSFRKLLNKNGLYLEVFKNV